MISLNLMIDSKGFPVSHQDFNVVHNYLVSNSPDVQARIRKRGQSSNKCYLRIFFLFLILIVIDNLKFDLK